jgi:transketolase
MTVDPARLAPMADAIRALSMDAVQAANSGHPGMPMGMADVATVLFARFLKFDPARPDWADRDRFVLSAGHGSMLIYSLLHLTGYAKPTMEDIRNFRQWGSPCAGHPENHELPGVECTTGPLGQGLAMAVGMAMAERHLNAEFGDLVDHRTWVIAGDGCLMEGINHEAIGLAGHLKLGRLNVLWDDNRITIDGGTDLSTSEDIPARYRAAGWHTVSCDGHDFADIERALAEAAASPLPSLVACKHDDRQGRAQHGRAATRSTARRLVTTRSRRRAMRLAGSTSRLWCPTISSRTGARSRTAARRSTLHGVQGSVTVRQRREFERRMLGDLPAGNEAGKVFADWLPRTRPWRPARPRKCASMCWPSTFPT